MRNAQRARERAERLKAKYPQARTVHEFSVQKIVHEFCFAFGGQDSDTLEWVKQLSDEFLGEHITFISRVPASN